MSLALGIGFTFESFQAVGTFCWVSDRLNMRVREFDMDEAVFRSICPDIPSGPVAVCVWCRERSS